MQKLFQAIYHGIPLSLSRKQRIRNWLFKCAPGLFKGHPAYSLWEQQVKLPADNTPLESRPLLPSPPEVIIEDRQRYETHVRSDTAKQQKAFEDELARTHAKEDAYTVSGLCEPCRKEVPLLVDKLSGGAQMDGYWLPNWRERCLCPICHLNTRQRNVAARVAQFIEYRRQQGTRTDAYLMEQITPIFSWLTKHYPEENWVGSEYLDPSLPSGSIVKGLRHEDVENLSFPDASFDLIVSNDVLEHVVDPVKSIQEVFRVLRPGGEFLLTVPFHVGMDRNIQRAKIENGNLVHLLPEVYHGNPVSKDGSLVFTDFGWDFISQMRESGFTEVALHLYWAKDYGYLGVGQHYIRAVKPVRPA